MSRENSVDPLRWPVCLVGGILAAVLFLAIWIPTHPARTHLPTSDLYTHLSVARHLARGDGFLTDMTYPLSFAFPFARDLPQPLIHRQPGFALLLTVPYLTGGDHPGRVLDHVRRLQVVLLGMVLAAGGAMFLRRGNRAAVLPWLVLFFCNPLLAYAVDWGLVELACSLLMIVLWLRTRGSAAVPPDWIDGLLAGALAMLRLDLFWVPILWWVLRRPVCWKIPRVDRRTGLLLLVWLAVITPWAVRNLQVAGQPFFSLQTYAEHVKDTRSWPGYAVYRQLEPQPLIQTMASDPVPVLRKAARGLRFYFREMPRLLPLPALAGLVFLAVAFLWRRQAGGSKAMDGPSGGPAALALLTAGLLSIQYAFFDHSLRHLLVVFPVLVWEFSTWLGSASTGLGFRAKGRWAFLRTPGGGIVLAAAAVLAVVFLFPCRVPGWDSAAKEAVNLEPQTAEKIDAARRAKAGILFVDNSAVPWFVDRPVVWSPLDQETRKRICELLGQPEANPKEDR